MSKLKLIMGRTRSALFTLNTVLLKEKTQTRGFGIVLTRAGYRSNIFNIDTDTLSSIPERYFFRHQFYEISFNKITLSQKTLVLFFFSLLTFIQTQRLISWATAQRN